MDCYEAVSGARMHAAYYRPGGVYRDLPEKMPQYRANAVRSEKAVAELNGNRQGSMLDFISDFAQRFPSKVDEYETLLTDNRIWKQRTVASSASSRRSARWLWDLAGRCCADRASNGICAKPSPTRSMKRWIFDIPVGVNGDCYDRYLVRIAEMRQSIRIVRQCVAWLRENPGAVMVDNFKVAPPKRFDMKTNMEELIHHFKLFTEGMHLPAGEAYCAVEHPKGEFGIYLISDGANKPYRLKIRAPGFAHLAAMDEMARGHMIADAVAIIGTMDVVFGEIDR